MTRYATIELDIEEWVVDALIEDGIWARRGNQHMKGLYLTDKGKRWFREWCANEAVTAPRRAAA